MQDVNRGLTFWVAVGGNGGFYFAFHPIDKAEPTLFKLCLWRISFVVARYDVEDIIVRYALPEVRRIKSQSIGAIHKGE